ncbi:MAG TPA: hypothetical protein VFT74_20390 [Isosphaeraceae bacterium]|nr:hypothetical protein [Isosphaeraceae bacterium]
MSTDRANDLRAFRGLIDEYLANGDVEMTLEKALLHWEIENQADLVRTETVETIRRGFTNLEAGRVRPACPLESAATLGIIRTFRTYKPARECAGFLEVRHLDKRVIPHLPKPTPGASGCLLY